MQMRLEFCERRKCNSIRVGKIIPGMAAALLKNLYSKEENL
jgi:hypothetical protein